jgi:hypothetical protein
MNDRIQNLKDKIWTEEYWTNPDTDKLLPAQLNRFAELIVRECTNICEELGDKGLDGHYCVDKIKEHFGIQK